jgi:hypothetical protein
LIHRHFSGYPHLLQVLCSELHLDLHSIGVFPAVHSCVVKPRDLEPLVVHVVFNLKLYLRSARGVGINDARADVDVVLIKILINVPQDLTAMGR